MIRLNPSLAASFILSPTRETRRTSPASPTSPNTRVPGVIALSAKDDSIAAAIARSAAGSVALTPPTAFRNMS